MKPLIIGQSPARSGDGRPFTGASGMRLCRLLGLPENYDELTARVDLANIFSAIPAKRMGVKGDPFDAAAAKFFGYAALDKEVERGRKHIVTCGLNVWRAFGGDRAADWFDQFTVEGTTVHLFPHPSGISHYWNYRSNVERAERFLRRLVLSA